MTQNVFFFSVERKRDGHIRDAYNRGTGNHFPSKCWVSFWGLVKFVSKFFSFGQKKFFFSFCWFWITSKFYGALVHLKMTKDCSNDHSQYLVISWIKWPFFSMNTKKEKKNFLVVRNYKYNKFFSFRNCILVLVISNFVC